MEARGGYFGGPGAHVGGPVAHLEDFLDFCDFGDLSAAKVGSLFEVIFDTFWMQFLVFFSVPIFLDFL